MTEATVNDSSLTFTRPISEYAIVIYGTGNNPIVSIAWDGTVTVQQKGREPEAAEQFWSAVEGVFKRRIHETPTPAP